MCGCPEMEGYEEFCLRSLAVLQEEGKRKKTTCEPRWSLKALSVIRFHGRAVLSPLLSAEQRSEMWEHRQKAVQLEVDMQNMQKNNRMNRVKGILDLAQAHKVPSEDVEKLPVYQSATVTGYTLVTDSPELPRDPGFGLQTTEQPCSETPILNGYKAVDEVMVEKEEKSEEEEEEEDDDDISLDSLLKRSREYVKREQTQQKSNVVHTVTRTPPPETICDKERKSCSPMEDTGFEFGFSLNHSPICQPQTQIQYQTLYDPSPQQTGGLSPSLPDRYARLPSPQSGITPRAQKRKPRPFSTGNIHISFPIGPADLIPRSPVTTAEQQRAVCRIGAIIRGFLTRRLLKTEKVKHLRQTIKDTQEFIRSFQTEAPQKRGPCSAQDRSLQERVRAQLRAALYDIHDIFFEKPLWDRLPLLQQDRELRAERKLRDLGR
ncbi:Centriolar coiled-coil protein [Liparis tanakae]|uniref:Centriolar coiled-coil protein n=1 Tax=Liparis tanakae TaxID=230148 RepID=A0A4Z2J7T6_9TELE|nr:Centriolar coiled-coil protein [Liparis tanakae]